MAPIGLEERDWAPRYPQLFSRAEVLRQTGKYYSAVVPPIATQQIDIPTRLAADVEEAARSLTDFDSYAQRTLGIESPELGPMAAILLRTESASSSQIELLTTSARSLALAEIDEGETANSRSVVGNVRAMEAAIRLSDRLDEGSILDMHRELMLRSMAEHAGKWRTELVWIGGDNAGPRGAVFVAPQHEGISSAIKDLVAFIGRVDLPAVAQIAIAHAQFETIHPFVDGNGRTGRALAQATIRKQKLATGTTVPVSAGLLRNTETYFDALTRYRAGDAGPIVRRFADACRFATQSGKQLVDELRHVSIASRELLAGVRSQSSVWRILPLLIGQPVVNLGYLRSKGYNDMTALRALDTLTSRGVLTERSGRRRNRIWEHASVLAVLDDYASRIRRSSPGTQLR
ncbi:MAG: Fic family protein [Cryobacterium sp.]|nr:Fic family protein [Cryobacterium sp.]